MKTRTARLFLANKDKPKANKKKVMTPTLAVVRVTSIKQPVTFVSREVVKVGRVNMMPIKFFTSLTKSERRDAREQLAAAGVKFDPITYGMSNQTL